MTPAQKAIIKTDILAKQASGQPLFGVTSEDAIAAFYNTNTGTAWRTEAPVDGILDGIDFSKYTPTDTPEATGIYTARAQSIQIKQMNLQNMLIGRERINAAKVTIRASLRDAVIAVPAGASGAPVSPGGASGINVLNACTRPAKTIELLLAAGSQASDTTGTVTARVLTYEGSLSAQDVSDIVNGI